MSLLLELSKSHIDWLKMAKSIGSDAPDDLVQDMYIKLHRYSNIDKILCEGKINTLYVWVTLRNLFYDEVKHKNKFTTFEFTMIDESIDFSGDAKINDRIEAEIDSWEWYDKMLFNIYKNTKKSMRDLAKETKISLSSINNTLQNCKKKLIENVGEDYQDYLNNDYELI